MGSCRDEGPFLLEGPGIDFFPGIWIGGISEMEAVKQGSALEKRQLKIKRTYTDGDV